jgi:hypothetical protein
MSSEAVEAALDLQGLKPQTKFIATILAHRINHRTGKCNPSVRSIAADASMHQRTVHLHLNVLKEMGELIVENRSSKYGQLSNQYWLQCDLNLRSQTGDGTVGPYATRTIPKNLNLNPIIRGQSGKRGTREAISANQRFLNGEISKNNQEDQAAQVKLATMFGPLGWEILMAVPERVPLLVGKLRRGVLKPEHLEEARREYHRRLERG